ncbi:unnamed protein product [Closterium sp. Naga37s-1]|nr:unnamed protein product [Closterium sp. Naga37s-1]
MSRIAPTLVPVTLLLWVSQRLKDFRDISGPDDSPRRRLEHFQPNETPILRSFSSTAVGSAANSADSSGGSRGDSTREDAFAAAAGSPSSASTSASSAYPRVFEAGQGSCGFPDTRADAEECVADLAEFPALSARSRSATARKLACLAHNYLRPWMGIPGVTAGMGARGMINPAMLQEMGTMTNVLSCAGHVRIVRGKIFFRFGNFEFDWYRLRRFVFSIKMIQDAIREYKLHNLNAEFFLNTCDMYISKASSVAKPLAGLPIFSVHGAPGSIDILYPDPVDLSSNYFREAEDEIPWEQKESRAVFRGGMTNYRVIYPKHWRGSPRFRVHRMSDVRPDLLDARVPPTVMSFNPHPIASLHLAPSPFSLASPSSVFQPFFPFGKRLGPFELQSYKYELDVQGGAGSGRVCSGTSGTILSLTHLLRFLSLNIFHPLLHPFYPCSLRQDAISFDAIAFGKRLGPTELQSYKYELDVDGGTGSGRVCGVLSSSQMLIKQASEYSQFFDPLMCPYRHFLPTHRFFSDLFMTYAHLTAGDSIGPSF